MASERALAALRRRLGATDAVLARALSRQLELEDVVAQLTGAVKALAGVRATNIAAAELKDGATVH